MNLENYIKQLEKRIIEKRVASVAILAQAILVVFGIAGAVFYFEIVQNEEPEYLRYFDDRVWRLNERFERSKANIESILEEERILHGGIENNLLALNQELAGVAQSLDGFSEAFNRNRFAIADSHLSSKRITFGIFSIFLIIYVKFLLDAYKYNASHLSRDRAILDAILLSSSKNEDGTLILDREYFKELVPYLELHFRADSKDSVNINGIFGRHERTS